MSEIFKMVEATPQDAELIEQLAHVIWLDAYRDILSKEQMDYMLTWMYSPEVLRQQMADGHTFLLAMLAEKTVGFAGFSIKDSDLMYWKLHKIYLLLSIGTLFLHENMVSNKNTKSKLYFIFFNNLQNIN